MWKWECTLYFQGKPATLRRNLGTVLRRETVKKTGLAALGRTLEFWACVRGLGDCSKASRGEQLS